MKMPKLASLISDHFNLLLLVAACGAFLAGIQLDLSTRFYLAAQMTDATLVDALFSLMVVAATIFPIFAINRSAQLRAANKHRALVQARSHYDARHDSLTGLGSRLLLKEVFERRRGNDGLALMLLDLDHFKPVNDLRGHDVGDQVLIQVAKRLRAVCPDDATICRLGADDFAVLVPMQDDAPDLAEIAEELHRQISKPIVIGNFTIAISASCGVAFRSANMGIGDLTNHAEQALSAAKSEGRADYRIFDVELGLLLREEALLQADLIEAVVGDGLYCVYQPYFDMKDQRLVGAEVLARWKHPRLGHIPPDRFIRMADKLGLIDKLSDQLLEKACKVARNWPRELMLSFNVTPSQFSDVALADRILRVLDRHDMSCDRFEVELTEHALLSDEARARSLMNQLIDAGVQIALDDFGTGTSSLSLLTAYPFHRLKIDRSFVRDAHIDPTNNAITKGVAQLAHGLDMAVTAEGIEHAEELNFLRDLKPIYGQGYLLGRPLSEQDMDALIATQDIQAAHHQQSA